MLYAYFYFEFYRFDSAYFIGDSSFCLIPLDFGGSTFIFSGLFFLVPFLVLGEILFGIYGKSYAFTWKFLAGLYCFC